MPLQLFKRCLIAAYGDAWSQPAAILLDIRIDKLQAMWKGQERIYPETAHRIVLHMRARRENINELLTELGET